MPSPSLCIDISLDCPHPPPFLPLRSVSMLFLFVRSASVSVPLKHSSPLRVAMFPLQDLKSIQINIRTIHWHRHKQDTGKGKVKVGKHKGWKDNSGTTTVCGTFCCKKQKRQGRNSSIFFLLVMWEIWSAKGSPLYVYLLKRSICCGFACKRNREACFSSDAILHWTGGSIAAALYLNEEEGGRGRQRKMDGWEEGRRARKAVRGFFLVIVAAEVASVSGFISA